MENNIRLYTIENEIIPNNFVTDSPSFFIMSFQKFAIKLNNIPADSNTKVFSVVEDFTPVDPSKPYLISENTEFPVTENHAYTIFFDKEQTLSFDVSGIDGVIKTYILQYIPENSHDQQLLFDDLITNNHLPKLEELLPCILNDVNKRDIVQRMLLDFKRIVNTKGTKKTIEKFFSFIGFGGSDQFHIFDEYISTITGTPISTITPNKSRDFKTGDYWVIYDNYEQNVNPYDKHNLPNRQLDIQDLDEFWLKLERAISLANIYFILPEQSINRFTLNNSVNIPKFQSIASNTSINFSQNVHGFNDKIHIYAWSNLATENSNKYFISNNLKKNNEFGNTELKYYISDAFFPKPNNRELFLIEKQIYDKQQPVNGEDEFDYISTFGCVMRLVVDEILPSEDIWCEYTIEYTNNQLTRIKKEKFLMTDKIDVTYISTLLGDYKITIDFFNGSNNRERYVYGYSVSVISSILDFDSYSSVIIMEDEMNDITTDITSPSEVTVTNDSRLLQLGDIPDDLSTYFTVEATETPQYLQLNKLYSAPKINKNFPVASSTEMPVDYMDTYLDVITFKYNPLYQLKMRVKNISTGEFEIVDYFSEDAYEITPDCLFVTTMDIFDPETNTETPYIFLTTTQVGVDLMKELFDLVLQEKADLTNLISVYDIKNTVGLFDYDFKSKQIPLNFDIPLFHRTTSISTEVVHYPEITTVLNVKSIFPRLLDLSNEELNVKNIGYSVLYGDIFTCKINPDYIVNMIDITWNVYNAFTGELLFSTKDLGLKYRVEDLIVFDVNLTFRVKGGGVYTLTKKSLFTAYKLN